MPRKKQQQRQHKEENNKASRVIATASSNSSNVPINDDQTTNDIGSSNASHSGNFSLSQTSLDMADLIRSKIRRELVEELLDACGTNQSKRCVIQQLAHQVLQRDIPVEPLAELSSSSDGDDDDGDSKLSEDRDEDESPSSDKITGQNKRGKIMDHDHIDVKMSNDAESCHSRHSQHCDSSSELLFKGSPYEAGAISMEDGDDLFDAFKELLIPYQPVALPSFSPLDIEANFKFFTNSSRRSGQFTLQPSPNACDILGKSTAMALVNVYDAIEISAMTYKSEWINGKIRGRSLQGVTKLMVLACLQETRICRMDQIILKTVINDLNVTNIVREALDDIFYSVAADKFPKLSNCLDTPSFVYHSSHQKKCKKCELFVARTYVIMNFLKRDTIHPALATKLIACLDVMEENLIITGDQADYGSQDDHINDQRQKVPSQIQIPEFSFPSSPSSTIVHDRSNEVLKEQRSEFKTMQAHDQSLLDESTEKADDTTRKNSKSIPFATLKSTPVEQLCVETGKVLKRWNSIRDANVALGKEAGNRTIIHYLREREQNANRKSSFGFGWRKYSPLECDDQARKRTNDNERNPEVEQIDLTSGEVVAHFSSVSQANISLGLSAHCTAIHLVLSGDKCEAHGFYWRHVGSSKLPKRSSRQSPSKAGAESASKNSKPEETKSEHTARSLELEDDQIRLEKIDIETGQVLDIYESIRDANISLGRDPQCSNLRKAISGKYITSGGFKWRRVIKKVTEVTGNTLPVSSLEDFTPVRSTVDSIFKNERKRKGHNDELSSSSPKKMKGNDSNSHFENVVINPYRSDQAIRAISGMKDVLVSPYQQDATAEVGEEIFDSFKELLISKHTIERQSYLTEKAISVFGDITTAKNVVDFSKKIADSGMLYSAEWMDGCIRGTTILGVSKNVLLLLMQEQRFSQTGAKDSLLKVVRDFKLCQEMIQCLVCWNLVNDFQTLSQVRSHTMFRTQRMRCCKCLIFIARVRYCMMLMKVQTMPESIRRKIYSCFRILESSLARPLKQGGISLSEDAEISGDDVSIVGLEMGASSPPAKITTNSHVLFQMRSPSEKTKEAGTSKPLSTNALKRSLSANTHLVTRHDHSSWVPKDSEEVVLTPLECEMAWLIEESNYCLRVRNIEWRFIWKYASPLLQMKLRQIGGDTDPSLSNLVRLDDEIAAARFRTLRQNVRRKLLKGYKRPRMENVIEKERLASRSNMMSQQHNNSNVARLPSSITTSQPK